MVQREPRVHQGKEMVLVGVGVAEVEVALW